MQELQAFIEKAWGDKSLLSEPLYAEAVREAMECLDRGEIRVAEPVLHGVEGSSLAEQENPWRVNQWVKEAVLLYFSLAEMQTIELGPFEFHDKIPLKKDYARFGVRVVPHGIARYGSFLEPGVVMMPSYVNIGARVGQGSMVDTWATVGSCAQVGKHVHLSGGAGIGGVLEPVQAGPTIIEDNCFIGARSEVVEGVIVGEGSVISMGVFIGKSTKIYDRTTGEIMYGKVPPYSVVVSGNLPSKDGKYSLYAAIIVKHVDERTRSKIGLNELLRQAEEEAHQ